MKRLFAWASTWRNALLDTVALSVVSVLAAMGIHDAFRANLAYPLSSEAGDTTFYAAHVFKASLDNPWYLHNQFLNAPNGLDIHDFPTPDLFVLLFIKLCGVFTKNWALAENLYYLASFPFATLAAYAALRHFAIRRSVAATAALAFGFLPFHQLRGLGHILFGCTYWQAPLTAILCVWLVENRRVSPIALALALFVGLTGMVYYPFFSLACLAVGAVSGAVYARSSVPLVRGGVLMGTVGAGIAVNVVPTFLYQLRAGKSAVILRTVADAELFGLKLTNLVLPTQGHRVAALSLLRKKYDDAAPLTNENMTAYLGVVGVIGLGFLAARLFFPSGAREKPEDRRMDLFARCGAFCFLLGTVGGIGSLVAFFLFNKVRSYNRISPFIAFFCLALLATVVERALRRANSALLARAIAFGAAPAIGAFAMWEQSFEVSRDWREYEHRYDKRRAYYEQVENALPPNGAIFQVPYVSFPEAPPLEKLDPYEMSQPYLFTTRAKYSYPAMLGRPDATWHERLAHAPLEQLADAVAANGFDGLMVYRVGFADNGKVLEDFLTTQLGPPLVAPDGRSVFFKLTEHRHALAAKLGPGLERLARFFRDGPTLLMNDTFGALETLGDRHWHWMLGPKASFTVTNPLPDPIRLDLSWEVSCHCDAPHLLRMTSPRYEETFTVERTPQRIVHTVEVPPGDYRVEVQTDAPRVVAPADPRTMYVQFFEPSLRMAR